MEITWLGHACFRIRGTNVTLLTDPFPDSLGLSLGTPQAAIVTISNSHPNHSYWPEAIQEGSRILQGAGEYEIRGAYIRGVRISPPSKNPDPQYRQNIAFIMAVEGVVLCHLGDIAYSLTSHQMEEMSPVDLLFIPVGSGCTLSVPQTVEVIATMGPKLVVPMHYALPGLAVELEPLDPFLREMGLKEVTPQPRLTVTRSTIPNETTVVVLQPPGT